MMEETSGQNKSSDDGERTSVCEPIAIRITDGPPTSEDQKEAQRDAFKLQLGNLILGFLTLGAVVAYACFAHEQVNKAIEANVLAREREHIELRPYVGFGRGLIVNSPNGSRMTREPRWESTYSLKTREALQRKGS
jgi:hypothetical protein